MPFPTPFADRLFKLHTDTEEFRGAPSSKGKELHAFWAALDDLKGVVKADLDKSKDKIVSFEQYVEAGREVVRHGRAALGEADSPYAALLAFEKEVEAAAQATVNLKAWRERKAKQTKEYQAMTAEEKYNLPVRRMLDMLDC